MKNFTKAIINIFEKIAIIRTRQALAFLSDNELSQLGLKRHQLASGNFYKVNEVVDFPSQKSSVDQKMEELEIHKAA